MSLPTRFYIFGYLHDPSDWELTEAYEWGHRGWTLTSGLRRDKRDLSLDGAVTSAPDFVAALREIVAAHPELASWSIDARPVAEILAADTPTPLHRKVYLHGTSEAAYEAIKSSGLLPRSKSGAAPAHGAHISSAPRASEHAIYLTTEMDTAAFASRDAVRGGGRGRRVVLRVSPPFNAERFSADEDSRSRSAESSLQTLGSVAYHGAIPPEQIELHAVYDDDADAWVFQNPLRSHARLRKRIHSAMHDARRNPLIVPGVDLVDDLFYASVWGLKQFGQELDLTPQVDGVTKQLVASIAAARDAYSDNRSRANLNVLAQRVDAAIDLLEEYHDPDGSFIDDVMDGLDLLANGTTAPQGFDPVEGLLYLSPEFRRARVYDDATEAFIDEVSMSEPNGWRVFLGRSSAPPRVSLLLPEPLARERYGIQSTIQIELLPIAEGQSGFFTYDAEDATSTIGLGFLPSGGRRATDFLSVLYLTIAHETIHMLQNQKGLESKLSRSSDYTGLPYTRRREFMTHDKATEQILRAELAEVGLDPKMANIHTLDDIEFYTKLFEEILYFLQHIDILTAALVDPATGCPLPLENVITTFITDRPFFRSLQHFQRDKFELAASEFTDAIQNRREEFDALFVCKLRDPRRAIRVTP